MVMTRSKREYLLRPISWIILYYGIETSDKPSFRPIWSALLRFKSLLLMSYSVVVTLWMCIHVRPMYAKTSEFNLYVISYHIKTWLVLITFLNFTRNENQIRSILFDIERGLDAMALKKIRIFSWFTFCICLATTFTTALFYSVFPLLEDWSVHRAIRELIWSTQGLLWIFSTHSHLIIVCYGVHLIERNSFRDIFSSRYFVLMKNYMKSFLDKQF